MDLYEFKASLVYTEISSPLTLPPRAAARIPSSSGGPFQVAVFVPPVGLLQ